MNALGFGDFGRFGEAGCSGRCDGGVSMSDDDDRTSYRVGFCRYEASSHWVFLFDLEVMIR